MTFFSLYRKKGFSVTLEILNDFEKGEAKESEFFNKLKNSENFLNEFYRSKEDLLKYDLISYKLDKDFDKVLCITEKGKKLLEKIKDINSFLFSEEKK